MLLFNLKKIIKKVLKKEKRKGSVSLKLTNDFEIRRLNKKFRKIDRATDVLAFPFGEEGVLGDIAISTETAKRNAVRYGTTLKKEYKRLVIHGILHLLGYDHGKKMREKEAEYSSLKLAGSLE